MDFLNKLFSKKQSETPSSNATHKKQPEAENITPPETVSQNVLRLASPNHPARKQIVEVSDYLNKSVKVESAGGAYLVSNTIDFGVAEKMGVILDEGIALAPDDCDMLVAKAIAVQSYRGGFQETS